MKDKLISIKNALLAKEKGFNLETIYYYSLHKNVMEKSDHSGINCVYSIENRLNSYNLLYPYNKNICDAPTQSLLHKWLRDVHNTFIGISIMTDCELNVLLPFIYQFDVTKDGKSYFDHDFYDSYEDAMESAISYSLILI